MQDNMNETMNEINGTESGLNMRQTLQADIASIKKNITAAQKELEGTNLLTTLQSAISPEQANMSKKKVVFLKKDLANKQSEYEHLDQ